LSYFLCVAEVQNVLQKVRAELITKSKGSFCNLSQAGWERGEGIPMEPFSLTEQKPNSSPLSERTLQRQCGASVLSQNELVKILIAGCFSKHVLFHISPLALIFSFHVSFHPLNTHPLDDIQVVCLQISDQAKYTKILYQVLT
jgi:hypothetical protein